MVNVKPVKRQSYQRSKSEPALGSKNLSFDYLYDMSESNYCSEPSSNFCSKEEIVSEADEYVSAL